MNLLNFIVATKKSPNVYLFFPWMFKYFLFIFECCQYTMRMPMSDLFWLGFSENFGLANWCYSLVSQPVKKLPAMRGQGFNPWVRKIPWRRAWQPTPVFLPGRISQTEEYGSPQFMGSQRVRHDWATNTQHNTIKAVIILQIILSEPLLFHISLGVNYKLLYYILKHNRLHVN